MHIRRPRSPRWAMPRHQQLSYTAKAARHRKEIEQAKQTIEDQGYSADLANTIYHAWLAFEQEMLRANPDYASSPWRHEQPSPEPGE